MDEIENMLMRYRPVRPGEELRERVVGEQWRWSYRVWAFRAAVAAMLLIAVGLETMAARINRMTAANVGAGPVLWDENAEQAAKLVDGGKQGRQYIALYLMGEKRGAQ